MTTIEKMDLALDTAYKYKHKRIKLIRFIDEFMATFQITAVDLGGCIRMLEDDGYIREFVDEDEKEKIKDFPFQDEARQHYTFLVITMKGMLFKEQGGYGGVKRNRAWSKRKNIAVTMLTLFIGVATVYYARLQYQVSKTDADNKQSLKESKLSLLKADSTIRSQQYYIDSLKNILSNPANPAPR
jgi:hypothetical protein